MDAIYFRRHKYSLFQLGAVLSVLLGGVVAAAVYGAATLHAKTTDQRKLASDIRKLEDEGASKKQVFEGKARELQNVKIFADRINRYLALSAELNRATGTNSNVLVYRLAADNALTVTEFAPEFKKKRPIGGQPFVGSLLRVQLTGTYAGCGRFLASLENSVPFLRIEQLLLESAEVEGETRDMLRLSLLLFIIDSIDNKP